MDQQVMEKFKSYLRKYKFVTQLADKTADNFLKVRFEGKSKGFQLCVTFYSWLNELDDEEGRHILKEITTFNKNNKMGNILIFSMQYFMIRYFSVCLCRNKKLFFHVWKKPQRKAFIEAVCITYHVDNYYLFQLNQNKLARKDLLGFCETANALTLPKQYRVAESVFLPEIVTHIIPYLDILDILEFINAFIPFIYLEPEHSDVTMNILMLQLCLTYFRDVRNDEELCKCLGQKLKARS